MKMSGLSSQYYEAIGKIAISTSGLERTILSMIHYCSSIQTWNEAACLLGGDSFDVLCKKADRIVKCNLSDEPTLLKLFEPISDALYDIKEKRNQYIHSMWTPPIFRGENLPRRRKFRPKFEFLEDFEFVKEVPIEELHDFIDKIGNTQKNFINFVINNIHTIRAAIHRRASEEGLQTR